MPRHTDTYRVRNGLWLVPTEPDVGTTMPFSSMLWNKLDELHRRSGTLPKGLSNYALLAFFEAPTTLHNEDIPAELTAAIQDAMQRALQQFAESHADVVAVREHAHAVHCLTVPTKGPTWRVYFALAPRTAPIDDTRLQHWYRDIRPYWPMPLSGPVVGFDK